MTQPPSPKVNRRHTLPAEKIERSGRIGQLRKWADDPANEGHPVAESVRALLLECERLANNTAAFEDMRTEIATLRSHNQQYQARHTRDQQLIRELRGDS